MQENIETVKATGDGTTGFQHRKRGPKQYPLYPVTPRHAIKRNDPCPCGSGKKAKKCCLARISALASLPAEVRTQMIVEGVLHKPPAEPRQAPPAVQQRFNELVAQQTAATTPKVRERTDSEIGQVIEVTNGPQPTTAGIAIQGGYVTTPDGRVAEVISGKIEPIA